MESGRSHRQPNKVIWNSPIRTVMLVCLVAVLSYLIPKFVGALLLHPKTVWPFWPGCALLVAALLLVPRKIWPMLIAAAFAGIVLYDLQAGVPIRSINWFLPADTVEVLIAAFTLSYFFEGVPRLDSVKALAKYSFFAVFLAPFASAFLSASGIHSDYWTGWRIGFFSEVLAFVALVPAILSWISGGPAWAKKSAAYYLEGAALLASLGFVGYLALAVPGRGNSPVLLCSLVPLLLWSALRFGSMGAATSVIVIVFFSIWGAVHGRGPFTEPEPIDQILSLDLFLFFAAAPFMVLAALVEERKRDEKALTSSEERLLLATQAGKMFAYEWDASTDVLVRSEGSAQILGIDEGTPTTGQEIMSRVHADDRDRLMAAVAKLCPEKPYLEISYRLVRTDGCVSWVARSSLAHFDERGKMLRIIGMVADITERKKAERELVQTSERLRLAMDAGKSVGWEWDIKSGRNTWFGDLQAMFGISSDTFVGRAEDFYRYVHPEDRKLVSEAVGEAKRSRNPYSAEFRIVWPDGTERWVSSKGKFEYSPDGEAERMFGMAVDITEQRHAEESLRLFRKLIDQSNDAIEVIDPETLRFLDVNDKDCRELGYTREELLSLRVSDIDPTLNETSQAKVREKIKKSGFAIFDSIYRRKDGSTFPVEVNVKRVELERTYYVTVVRNITERRLAEEALRESDERLRLAVKAGRMYAFEWDTVTDVIVRSGESSHIFNWMPSPTIDTGRQFVERVHPDDRDAYMAADAQLTAADPFYQISYRIIRPDGSVVWLEDSGHAFFDGQGKMLRTIGMVADVTERKLAEEALRESEQRFRLVANSSPVMIWMSGTDKLCNFFNEGWLNFTGRSIEQELGDGWASGVHPDDLDRCLSSYSGAFEARLNFEMEYRLRRFDGEYRWIVDYGVPRFGADGTFCGYIGSCVDITDRKVSERSVLELSGRLIHAQEKERARIARELHDDLSQRIALLQIGLDQFEQGAGALPSQGRHQLHRIAELAGEVSSGIHGLSHQLHPSKLDTLGLLPSLGALCKEFSSLHNLQVQFVHRDVSEPISREVSLCLFRIVQEALRNVVKHSGATGAHVELYGHAGRLDLSISDSGTGFNPEDASAGDGLGLVSMRERLRLLGGQLSIESEPAHGTQIRVRVPLSGTTGQDVIEQKHYEANA
jgi:PAS domain S-box-containing protein